MGSNADVQRPAPPKNMIMNNEPCGAGPLEQPVRLLPCKCCGDSEENNVNFGARPEFVPGIFAGWFTRCAACGELSKSAGDSYAEYVKAWNRRA